MNLLSQEALVELVDHEDGVHVSLTLPLDPYPDQQNGNRIRLKNMIREAAQQLAAAGIAAEQVEALLAPATDLLGEGRFFGEGSRGMAFFLAHGFSRQYRWPVPLDEMTVISRHFQIKPLLPLLNNDGRFLVLALSQNEAVLWEGTQFDLQPLEVPDLPQGLEEALALEDPERSLQHRTSGAPSGAGAGIPAVFHGHEAEKEKKGAILRYLQQVDQALQPRLRDEQAPLLLATVDYLMPIFKQATTYAHVLEEGVTGNPDDLAATELHRQAWEVVEPYFEERRAQEIARYERSLGTEQSSDDLETVVQAAVFGRVDTLFTVLGRRRWGRFDQETGSVETHLEAVLDGDDLLNLAAIHTLRNRGRVLALSSEKMPTSSPLAAILRY